jgi:two-component system response regulator DevR
VTVDPRPITAVLVDDHQLVLDGLSQVLHKQGVTVLRTFLKGQFAVDFLDSRAVDLLVVDLRLPDVSGLSVVREVHRRHPRTKIAMLTSSDDLGAAAAAVRAGATGYFLKDTLPAGLGRQLRDVAEGNLVIDSRVAAAVLRPQELLTKQELAVLDLVADGLTNREIGARLHLSHHTIKDHLTKTMRKLGTSTRAETVAKAAARNLLPALVPSREGVSP